MHTYKASELAPACTLYDYIAIDKDLLDANLVGLVVSCPRSRIDGTVHGSPLCMIQWSEYRLEKDSCELSQEFGQESVRCHVLSSRWMMTKPVTIID